MTSSYKPSKCPECGEVYVPRRIDQAYCGKGCRKAGDNRAMARAGSVYALMMHWRFDRGSDLNHVRTLCAAISRWHDEDLAAGRPLPPLTVQQTLDSKGHYTKRQKPAKSVSIHGSATV